MEIQNKSDHSFVTYKQSKRIISRSKQGAQVFSAMMSLEQFSYCGLADKFPDKRLHYERQAAVQVDRFSEGNSRFY
jgi:hypothetical protein